MTYNKIPGANIGAKRFCKNTLFFKTPPRSQKSSYSAPGHNATYKYPAQPTAEVIVGTIDVIIPLLIPLLIRGSERDDTRLTADERDTLVEAWATYLGDKNIALSPSTSLIAMVTIYGSKIIAALTARRERRQLDMLRRRIESQQQQIATQQETIVALQREVQEGQNNNQ